MVIITFAVKNIDFALWEFWKKGKSNKLIVNNQFEIIVNVKVLLHINANASRRYVGFALVQSLKWFWIPLFFRDK